MRTRSRHWATARSRLDDTSQKPPSAASESVISTIALTATRPALLRSRSASPTRNPTTRSALVLHDMAAVERQGAALERRGQPGLTGAQHDRRATRPDVLERLEDLGGHRLVEVAARPVSDQQPRAASPRPTRGRSP